MAKEQKTKKFTIKMQKKLVVLFVLVLLAFAGLCARLVWITRENESSYQKQVLSQQNYTSSTIPYRRGDITDANGTILATSEKVYNLVIDAKVMLYGEEHKYLEPTLKALSEHFQQLDMSAIRKYITEHPSSSWYVPLRRLSYDEVSGFKAAQDAKDSLIRGVWFEEEYKRVYPYNSMASDVIGFTTTDGQGSYGLEEYYDKELSGINGREYGYLNDDLTLERTLKTAVDGYSIQTTIDANIQMVMEKCLKKYNEERKNAYTAGNGAENVGAVMMNIHTGEILGMASFPNFDLNDTRNTDALLGTKMVEEFTNSGGYQDLRKTNVVINESTIANMTSEQIYVNLNNLWKNYCITGTYEPGSTVKPFTVAAALEEGTIGRFSTFECNRYMEIGGYKIHCHNYNDGVLTLEQAIAKSCNVTMMKIAQAMGKDTFCEYLENFNFGLKTNVDLAGEARTASLVYTPDKMGPTDLATNSFGQNFNVTMIQMITGFSSLINGGYYYEPHIVSKIVNAEGATVENIEPRLLKQTISETTSDLIRQYCEAVVEYGTGKTARPAGYMVGGKTGTAETIDQNTHTRSEDEYVVSFMGYAPADNPQIALYVVVDRPNAEEQDDAKFATGIFRDIMTEVLPYLNIYMTESLSDAEKAELEALQIEITGRVPQTPEEEALENTREPEEEEEPDTNQPEWMSFPIDPATGYRVDPETGRRYDAESGFSVDGGETVVNPNLPVNPNIQ